MIIRREIGEKGQVVIPKDIREYLGLETGTEINFKIEDNKVILKREDSKDFLKEFSNVPKIERKLTSKELKKIYEKQYEKKLY